MASEVEICNLALSHLGIGAIQSFDEDTKRAGECRLVYDTTRDSVLGDHAWGFAKKRLVLAETDDEYTGWDYAYAYPSDCITAHEIYNTAGTAASRIAFEISNNAELTQRVILTNEAAAELIYTARVEITQLFGALFIEALAYAIAAKLAQPLKADKVLTAEMDKRYAFKVNRAKAISANEHYEAPDTSDNPFVSVRG